MDKYDYVIAKPEMEEVLYHAGFHKYIDKYLGKNGKWIYKYAGQAKNAVSGAVNKAKTMLPGLQKQATGAVSTARKAVSTGARTASTAKKQAQKRINAMLPILSKKFNSAKKKARSQAAGVKLVARDKTKKLKKQADGTMKSVSKTIRKASAPITARAKQIKSGHGKIKYRNSNQFLNNVESHVKRDIVDRKAGTTEWEPINASKKYNRKTKEPYNATARINDEYRKYTRRSRRRAKSRTVAGRVKY